jgi:DNA-3-methyladenine glycosylase II
MNSTEIQKGTTHIYNNDKQLAKIIDIAGECKLKRKKDYYHSLLKAIVGQQLSINAARGINSKFFLFFNNEPTPELILNAPDEQLRSLGLSWAKIKYVKDLSLHILEGKIHFNNLHKRKDEDIITDFLAVKGVGIWTVQMFLIFTLVRPNVLPLSDLGIRKAVMNLYKLRELPDEKKILNISQKHNWQPYSSIAAWYLWRSLELNKLK